MRPLPLCAPKRVNGVCGHTLQPCGMLMLRARVTRTFSAPLPRAVVNLVEWPRKKKGMRVVVGD